MCSVQAKNGLERNVNAGCDCFKKGPRSWAAGYVAHFFLIAPSWIIPSTFGPSPATTNHIFSGGLFCIFWLLALTFRGHNLSAAFWVKSVAGVWALSAIFSAVLGLVQYFGAVVTHTFASWITPAQIGQAYANLRQRNHFATLTNLGLAALLWWHASGQAQRLLVKPNPVWALRATVALAVLLAFGNAASGSRTGLLQLLLLGVFTWIWRPKHLPWAQSPQCQTLVLAACAYVLAMLVLPLLIGLDPSSSGILGRLQDASAACQSRRVLWANVLHLIAQKPWFGWGWGELDYAHFITLYPGPRFCDILDNAHNLPLHLAVELGVPFAVMVCGWIGWLILRQKPWRESNATRQLAWAVLALIGLHSLLEYPLWYGPFQMAVVLAVCMLWQTPAASGAQPPAQPGPSLAVRWAVGAAATLMLCACAYAAWDYWRISQIYTAPAQRAAAYRENTLQKLQASWLFKDYVQFAELTTTPLTRDSAERIHTLAVDMLHFSPEPKVVRLVISSAVMLGRDADAVFYLRRFKAAFPDENL